MRQFCISLICCLALAILCACSVTDGVLQQAPNSVFPSQLSFPGATIYQKGSDAQIDQLINTTETDLEELRGTTTQAYYLIPMREGEDFLKAQGRICDQITHQLSFDNQIFTFMQEPIDPMVSCQYTYNDEVSRAVGVITPVNETEMLVFYATLEGRNQQSSR